MAPAVLSTLYAKSADATRPKLGEQRPDLQPGIRIFRVGSHVVLYVPIESGIRVLRVLEGHRDYPALFRPPP